jgi:hypothetical protein
LLVLLGCHEAVTASQVPSAPPPAEVVAAHTLKLPPRRSDALTGSRFIDRAYGMKIAEREHAIVEEILAGNVPAFERKLVPVDLTAKARDGRPLRGRIFVLPDYLAIGSDEDFVRIPMTVRNARKIARESGTLLPTTRIVDEIQRAAVVRVVAGHMAAGDEMASVSYYLAHNRTIEERRKAQNHVLGTLLSGPKKDLVVSIRMLETSHRTPIYGWFNNDGSAIQALSLVHDDRYVDYAHGIRLVDAEMEVEGAKRELLDVLASRDEAALVSDEGAYPLRTVWEKGW